MPLYRRESLGHRLPWVEIDDVELLDLPADAARTLSLTSERERVLVLEGEILVDAAFAQATLKRNQWLELPAEAITLKTTAPAKLMRIAGQWHEATALAIFTVWPDRELDTHYHDCDEYWFFYRGRGTAVSEGIDYDVGPGDIVATGMGFEHGFLPVNEVVEAVAFETALEGHRRRGHLYREGHGDPIPHRTLTAVDSSRTDERRQTSADTRLERQG